MGMEPPATSDLSRIGANEERSSATSEAAGAETKFRRSLEHVAALDDQEDRADVRDLVQRVSPDPG